LPALSVSHERVLLFIAGILATVACTVSYRHVTIQQYIALMGNPALAGAIRRIGSGYGEILGSFFLFLAMAVWRPAPLGRYFNVLFWVWCVSIVLVSVMNDDLHPRQRQAYRPAEQTEQTEAVAPQSDHGPRPEGTMETWAQVIKDTPIAVNKDLAAYDAEIKATDGIQTTVMLTEPDQVAARLTRGRRTIQRHRTSVAKIFADARAALEDEQRTRPSPLLKMYEDRFAKEARDIDRDLAQYDGILAEFDATLHDLTNPHGLIEPRDGKIHFTTAQDRDIYSGHIARINQLVKERRAARNVPAAPPPVPHRLDP
jgi:hypothetical protein